MCNKKNTVTDDIVYVCISYNLPYSVATVTMHLAFGQYSMSTIVKFKS